MSCSIGAGTRCPALARRIPAWLCLQLTLTQKRCKKPLPHERARQHSCLRAAQLPRVEPDAADCPTGTAPRASSSTAPLTPFSQILRPIKTLPEPTCCCTAGAGAPKPHPALRHGHPHHETPHIPAPTSRRGCFYPVTAGHSGAGTPSAPIPHRRQGFAPRRAPSNRTGRRRHGEGSAASRSPPPRSHRRGPARAPPPAAPQRRRGTPQPACLGGRLRPG